MDDDVARRKGGPVFVVEAQTIGADVAGNVQDARTDLSYRYERLPVETAAFDTAPVLPAFRAIARGMRGLGQMLEAKAVALN